MYGAFILPKVWLKKEKNKKKKHPAVAMLKMYVNVEHWLRFVSVYTVS